MGYRDGGEDVREFRRAMLEGRVTPEPSLLLRGAMAEARTISDPAGNAKLVKGSEGGGGASATCSRRCGGIGNSRGRGERAATGLT